ncbi:hypothetical protein WJX74_001117 [Apatococcus lobatus]|uniref:Uncharacterized protein n=1 Tax=Apatococcus lobatus TaxID=904363 RepID=A0AAW1Q5M1_9CHLO
MSLVALQICNISKTIAGQKEEMQAQQTGNAQTGRPSLLEPARSTCEGSRGMAAPMAPKQSSDSIAMTLLAPSSHAVAGFTLHITCSNLRDLGLEIPKVFRAPVRAAFPQRQKLDAHPVTCCFAEEIGSCSSSLMYKDTRIYISSIMLLRQAFKASDTVEVVILPDATVMLQKEIGGTGQKTLLSNRDSIPCCQRPADATSAACNGLQRVSKRLKTIHLCGSTADVPPSAQSLHDNPASTLPSGCSAAVAHDFRPWLLHAAESKTPGDSHIKANGQKHALRAAQLYAQPAPSSRKSAAAEADLTNVQGDASQQPSSNQCLIEMENEPIEVQPGKKGSRASRWPRDRIAAHVQGDCRKEGLNSPAPLRPDMGAASSFQLHPVANATSQTREGACCSLQAITKQLAMAASSSSVPRGLPGKGLSRPQHCDPIASRAPKVLATMPETTAIQMAMVMVFQQAVCIRLKANLTNQEQVQLEHQAAMNGAMSELWNRKHQQVTELRAQLGSAKAAVKALKAAAQAAARAPAKQRLVPQGLPAPDILPDLKAAAEAHCKHLRRSDVSQPAELDTAQEFLHEHGRQKNALPANSHATANGGNKCASPYVAVQQKLEKVKTGIRVIMARAQANHFHCPEQPLLPALELAPRAAGDQAHAQTDRNQGPQQAVAGAIVPEAMDFADAQQQQQHGPAKDGLSSAENNPLATEACPPRHVLRTGEDPAESSPVSMPHVTADPANSASRQPAQQRSSSELIRGINGSAECAACSSKTVSEACARRDRALVVMR